MNKAATPANEDYQAFQIALQDSLGIVIGEENRGHIEGRLQPIMLRERLSRLSELASALRDDKPEHIRSEVLDAITTHNAGWFRHADILRLMGEYVLPSLIEKQVSDCRILYPACGFGRGVWSLAMACREQLNELGSELGVEIVATDVSQEAIDYAAGCNFQPGELEGLAEKYRQRYLNEQDGNFQLDEGICKMVHFKRCDLLSDACELGRFDVIVSPDILMYFSSGLKCQILEDYAGLLDPHGILLLNNGEPVLPFSESYEMVEHEITTFYRQIA